MRSRTPAMLVVLVVLAAGTAGCVRETPLVRPEVTGTTEPTAEKVTGRVSMARDDFEPRAVTVRSGEAVTWTNDDSVAHNVGGSGIVSGVVAPGTSFTQVFARPGVYQYLCTLHPSAGGMVEVVP